MSRTPSTSHEIQMDVFDNPPVQGKYAKRKSRFKRSDGSTSSDTTSNSFVRQDTTVVKKNIFQATQFLAPHGKANT
ncbi:hypothetical protein scyTo_0002707 [Scyliorhinus torazame]|uniref:Uncharacterized protein n=1 Tax=Scyliorhinus torazame TaxID=75743 RepID=A0A401PKG7_SCYTO|nr:hypothetical protein [Scyliorhinus torazame]